MAKTITRIISASIIVSLIFVFCLRDYSSAQSNHYGLEHHENYTLENPETGQTSTYQVLIDNPGIRKVRVWDNESVYIATYNKRTNHLTIKEDRQNGKTLEISLPNSEAIVDEEEIIAVSTISSRRMVDYSNYYYVINLSFSPNRWTVSTNQGIKTAADSGANHGNGYLVNFKNAIDAMISAESHLMAVVGGAVFSAIVVLISVPLGWTQLVAGLLALGLAAVMFPFVTSLTSAKSNADLYYSYIIPISSGGGGPIITPHSFPGGM